MENLESHQIQRARDSAKLVRVVAVKPALDAQPGRMAPAGQAATGHHLHMRAIENSCGLLRPVLMQQEIVNHQPVAHVGHADEHPAAGAHHLCKLGQCFPRYGHMLQNVCQDQAVQRARLKRATIRWICHTSRSETRAG